MRLAWGVVFWLCAGMAQASNLLEPSLHIAKGGPEHPQVALTLDACGGGTDHRILDVLVEHRIPATIFVTRKWLMHNPEALMVLVNHPELFEIENHGAEHVPPVLGTGKVYGITPAGTLEAVGAEVDGGADAIAATIGIRPKWYRGATALYSPDAVTLITGKGQSIAGFSVNGDYGASAFAADAARNIAKAGDGDVIISHINQPKRASGAGVAEGILALLAKGFRFVRLDQVETFGGDGRH